MNTCGLTENQLQMIVNVLAKHSDITGAIVFGSRAKGNYKDTSDIDIALEGIDTPLLAQAVAAELDELPLPQQFDVKAL